MRNRCSGAGFVAASSQVSSFDVDFFCEEAKVAVELDGGGHAEPAQVSHDARRTLRLEELGIRVLRFWNTDVLQNIDGVVERILEEVRRRPPSP